MQFIILILETVIYECNYEKEKFVVGVQKDNVIGLQFHPERSGDEGMFFWPK